MNNGHLESGDRSTGGYFAAKNQVARGNPNNRKMSILRATLLEAVDREKLIEAFRKLQDMALGGDLAAMKLYLSYAVGNPTSSVEVTGANGEPFAGGIDIRTIVLNALERHPDAKVAVAGELRAARDRAIEIVE